MSKTVPSLKPRSILAGTGRGKFPFFSNINSVQNQPAAVVGMATSCEDVFHNALRLVYGLKNLGERRQPTVRHRSFT
jgi:hypothetical protein